MQDAVKNYIARLARDRRRRRRLGSIIGMLSLVVAIGVFWQFKITGITMSDGQTPNDADPTANASPAAALTAPAICAGGKPRGLSSLLHDMPKGIYTQIRT